MQMPGYVSASLQRVLFKRECQVADASDAGAKSTWRRAIDGLSESRNAGAFGNSAVSSRSYQPMAWGARSLRGLSRELRSFAQQEMALQQQIVNLNKQVSQLKEQAGALMISLLTR